MILTNPYRGIATTDPANKHRLNLDVDHRDVVTINSVLMQHGALQTILNNIVKSYARYIATNALSFTDRNAFIERCTSCWPIREESGGVPVRERDSRVHEASPRKVCSDVCNSGGMPPTPSIKRTRKGKVVG